MLDNNKIIITDRDVKEYAWLILEKLDKFNEIEINVIDAYKSKAEWIVSKFENVGLEIINKPEVTIKEYTKLCPACKIKRKQGLARYNKEFDKIGTCWICGKKIPKEPYTIRTNIILLKKLPVIAK